MSIIRYLGLFLGVILIFFSFSQFRSHRIKNIDFLLMCSLGGSLIIIAITPGVVFVIMDMLAMEKSQYGRIITLLTISNLMLIGFAILLKLTLNQDGRQLRDLIRALGVLEFERVCQGNELIHSIQVIIPAFNEADNLEHILPKISKKIDGKDVGVLVVSDGCADNTKEVVERHGYCVVSNTINMGQGVALKLGYDIAIKYGAEIIVTMDADGQHRPEEIESLVAPIIRNQYDFVIGSRILGHRERDDPIRYFGIKVFNHAIRFLNSIVITDCTNGFRAFKASELAKLDLRQNQYQTSELIIDAVKRGIRLGEVPVTVLKRRSGESKKGGYWKYGFNFAKTIIMTWLR